MDSNGLTVNTARRAQPGAYPTIPRARVTAVAIFDQLAFAMTFYSPARLAGEWMLMVAAMMMPMLAGAIGHVRARSLPRRRMRSMALFMIGYCAIWAACGVPIVLAVLALQLMQSSSIVTIALAGSLVDIVMTGASLSDATSRSASTAAAVANSAPARPRTK